MENLRDPYFEKFINLTVDLITSEVKNKLKEFKPQNTEDNTLTYTPKEAAKVLGIGLNAIYELLKDDNFPSFKLSGGDKWYISKKGLDEWIENQIKNK